MTDREFRDWMRGIEGVIAVGGCPSPSLWALIEARVDSGAGEYRHSPAVELGSLDAAEHMGS